ncbi:MAG TPA: glycosyltransferase [Longimicrobiaceae bacterium]|nr:glycosyltransferase [Longimicrobiaceae bacterium]
MISVQVYPAFNARYYSFYIQGLLDLVGPTRLEYTTRGFPRFNWNCLALRVHGSTEKKIYIHSNDRPELDETGLRWCDAFGKTNLDPDLVPEGSGRKVIAIGPMMPVRVWGRFRTFDLALRNLWRSRDAIQSARKHLGNYRTQLARLPESAYRPGETCADYIFFIASLWEREPAANAARARFIDACRSLPGIRFEGGLTPRQSWGGVGDFEAPEYESYRSPRVSPREYVLRSRRSAVTFNNPAYLSCHSWRLAEHLAMGNAIVSVPIVRAMPASLEHETHVHYVDGSVDSCREAIRRILEDTEYREHLERNARRYYERYLAPSSVMRRLFRTAGIDDADVPPEPRGASDQPGGARG